MGRCSGKPEDSPSLEPCGSDAGVPRLSDILRPRFWSDTLAGSGHCRVPSSSKSLRTLHLPVPQDRSRPETSDSLGLEVSEETPTSPPRLRRAATSRLWASGEAPGFQRNPVAFLPARIRRSMAFRSAPPARPGPRTWPEQRLAAPLNRGTPSALPVSRLGFWRAGSGLPVPTGENVEHDSAQIKPRGYLNFAP